MMPNASSVAPRRGGRRATRAARICRLARSGGSAMAGSPTTLPASRPAAPSAAPGEEQRQEEEREAEAARDEEGQRRDQQAEADEHEGALLHGASVTAGERRRKPPCGMRLGRILDHSNLH